MVDGDGERIDRLGGSCESTDRRYANEDRSSSSIGLPGCDEIENDSIGRHEVGCAEKRCLLVDVSKECGAETD